MLNRNVATKGGVGSKNDRRAKTHFFEPGGYKIEPLLTKMVNDDLKAAGSKETSKMEGKGSKM